MTDSRNKVRSFVAVSLSLLLGLTTVSAHAYAWQEEEQAAEEAPVVDPTPESVKETPLDEVAKAEQAALDARRKAAELRKKRWYLGAAPQLPAQRGPSLGKPKNILPQPFVPASEDLLAALENDITQESSAGLSDNGSLGTSLDPADTADALSQEDLFEESALSLPDPSIMAAGGLTGLAPVALFDGANRRQITDLFNQLALRTGGRSQSPAFDAYLRSIIGLPLAVPASEEPSEIAALASARLRLAARLGDADTYKALIAQVDEERLAPYLGKLRAQHAMLVGDLSSACVLADTQRSAENDPFWIQLAVVCAAVQGNRPAVDFELSLLEEVADLSQVFFALVDRILLEAEAASLGNTIAAASIVLTDFDVTPLNVAMARFARAEVESVRFNASQPLAAIEALKLPGISNSAQADLVAAAIALGQIAPKQAVDILRAGSFDYDQAIADAPLEDAMADAALGSAALTGDKADARLDAASRLWQRARSRGSEVLTAMVLNEGLGDLEANGRLGSKLMPLFRVALVAQDDQRAAKLFRAMRAMRKGDDLVADQALILSIPIAVAAGVAESSALTQERLRDSVDVNGYAKTALLLSVIEGLDVATVSDAQWEVLEARPRLETRAANPVIWRRYLKTVQSGDGVAFLAMVPAVLDVLNGGGADPAFSSSVAAGFTAMGLDDLGRSLMREYLFSQGY